MKPLLTDTWEFIYYPWKVWKDQFYLKLSLCWVELVINKAPNLMVTLGLKITVLGISLILFIKSKLLCRCFAPLSNSKIFYLKFGI